ncbi:hypothetical protein GGE65_008115 [Skermanella aerolata]
MGSSTEEVAPYGPVGIVAIAANPKIWRSYPRSVLDQA